MGNLAEDHERRLERLNHNMEHQALKRQIGGDHYSKMDIQPAEFCLANMTVEELTGVLKWMNMKYMWRNKNSMREDWQKAKHYIEMIEEEISRRMDGWK